MKKFILLICILLFSTSQIFNQTVDGSFFTSHVGSVYSVKISTKMQSSTGTAGVVSIEFSFNSLALSFPSSPVSGTDYVLYGDFASYVTKNITRPSPNSVRISLITTGSPSPVPLSTDYTDIVTINLNIINANSNSNLVWISTNIAPQFLQSYYSIGTWNNLDDQAPLPIELTAFSAKQAGSKINLTWQTKTEVHNYGFDVERKISVNNLAKGSEWQKIGFVTGCGNSNSTKEYSFADNSPVGGKIIYRLKQIDTDGKFTYSDEQEVNIIPTEYKVYQNYPNPFNPSTTINFELPENSFVSLKVYDILGKEVASLVNEEKPAGYYNIQFSSTGLDLASGIYIYQLRAGNFVQTKKMILQK